MMKLTSRIAAVTAAASIIITLGCADVLAAKSGWIRNADGTEKYIMADGNYASGVMVIDDRAYSFSADGTLIGGYTGFISGSGVIFYYENGVLYHGWLVRPSGTYYLNDDGIAVVGRQNIDGQIYDFDSKGRLIVPKTEDKKTVFTLTASKNVYQKGSGTNLIFTVSAVNLKEAAAFRIKGLNRLKSDGKWYKVEADSTVYDEASGLSAASPSRSFAFPVDNYYKSLETGTYRLNVETVYQGNVNTISAEFTVINPYEVSTARDKYNIADTDRVYFSVTPNQSGAYVYSSVRTLYFRNDDGTWKAIKCTNMGTSNYIPVSEGMPVTVMLDLNDFNRSSLKTGTYKAELGNGITTEFRLYRPFEASAVQLKTDSERRKQIKLTVTDSYDEPVTINGYGKLWKYSGGKWKLVSLKGKKSLKDNIIECPAYYSKMRTMMLSDYYPVSSLSKGTYRMELPVNDGYSVYVYFNLK